MTAFQQSHKRCPRCGYRLMEDVGQDEDTGRCEVWLECWDCDYRERDTAWRDRTVHVVADAGRAARRLFLLRTRG